MRILSGPFRVKLFHGHAGQPQRAAGFVRVGLVKFKVQRVSFFQLSAIKENTRIGFKRRFVFLGHLQRALKFGDGAVGVAGLKQRDARLMMFAGAVFQYIQAEEPGRRHGNNHHNETPEQTPEQTPHGSCPVT